MRLKALRAFAVFCLIVFIESCGSEKHTIVGKVSPTANQQVALYSVSSSKRALVTVQIRPDTITG